MTRQVQPSIIGVFDDRAERQRALEALKRAGFGDDQISLISASDEGVRTIGGKAHRAIPEEAIVGAAGGLLGALASGLVRGVGQPKSFNTPRAAASNAVIGIIIGGIVGALIDRVYRRWQALPERRALVTAQTEGGHGVKHWDGLGQEPTNVGEHLTIKLHEERLRPTKTSAQVGVVEIRKDVVTERQTMSVPLTHEEVYVERRRLERARPAGEIVQEGQELRIPIRIERVGADQEPMVTEELRISRRPVTETKQVTGTVRREVLHVAREGNTDVRVRDRTVEREEEQPRNRP